MKDKMMEAKGFSKLLKYRELFKQLSQLTFSVRATENRFNYELPENTEPLLYQYKEFSVKLDEICEDLNIEGEEK